MFFLLSPLEQFEIIPLNTFLFITITNQVIVLFLAYVFVSVLFFSLTTNDIKEQYVITTIPNRIQVLIEILYIMILSMTIANIEGKSSKQFFPMIFALFFGVSTFNLIGLIPYSFTVTSHSVSTLCLSVSLFIGIVIISIRLHGVKFFGLFLPQGTSVILAFLLVPVEMISFVFKPLSLAIRLFCNMMAGHTLLKVFVGFSWTLINLTGFTMLLHIVPLLILLPLFSLELGVALIQAYVFSLLTCIYLNDAINLH